MRALLVGLGLVLTISGAQAAECRLDDLALVSEERGSNANPDLVGQAFRVTKQASQFKSLPDPVTGGVSTTGRISVLVEGAAGRFLVDQDYIPHSSPWVTAESRPFQTDAGVKWGQRDRKNEARYFEIDGSFDIYGGPLAGLTLRPTNCKNHQKHKP